MIPAAFDYQRAGLGRRGARRSSAPTGGAKVIAGGQSLLPLLKLRLGAADTLVDIGRLAELRGVAPARRRRLRGRRPDDLRRAHRGTTLLGWAARRASSTSATSRSATAARSAARSPTADPASDLPAIAARARLLGRSCARRAASGPFRSTASSRARSRPRSRPTSSSSRSVRGPLPGRRRGRLPEARAAGVGLLDRRAWPRSSRSAGGSISHARVALTGVGEHPYRAKAVEAALAGQRRLGRPRSRRPRRTPRTARPSTATSTPTATIASAMAVVYTRRAIEAALGR